MQIKEDLKNRIEEVNIYFEFAEVIDGIETHKKQKIVLNENSEIIIKRDLQKVIRANCFLILYNLIESTIRNGINEIHHAISDSKIKYDQLSLNLQKIWLTDKALEFNETSNVSKLKDYISLLIENERFQRDVDVSKKRVSISGNLDFRSIEKLVSDYGFHGKITIKDRKLLGKALLKVKNERNALAHGNKSFRQSAEIITIQDLSMFKSLIVSYLEDITKNISDYIEDSKFKKS